MFKLSQRSIDRLSGVHPDLCAVVRRAIQITEIDFCVTEGMRTKERQEKLLASGASTTMNSRHLTGHAVDLAAMIDFDGDGKPEVRWDWPLYEKLAVAMKGAAHELNVPIIWGGCWDRVLNEIEDVENAHEDYVARKKARGEKAFGDAPHFELDRKVYPA